MQEAIVAGSGHGEFKPQPAQKELSLEEIQSFRLDLERSLKYNTDRAARIEMLMKRHSAKKWKNQKKQKMVRRLMTSTQICQYAQQMIEQIDVELAKRDTEQ